MRVTLATPYTDADGVTYAPDRSVEVDDDTAGQLIRDGRARAAGHVQATEDSDTNESETSLTKTRPRRLQSTPESPATGATSEGVS